MDRERRLVARPAVSDARETVVAPPELCFPTMTPVLETPFDMARVSDLQRPAATDSSRITPADYDLIIGSRPNVLLHGSHEALTAALSRLLPGLRSPLHISSGVTWTVLSQMPGTVIIEHVASSTLEQQEKLLAWLDDARVQVITTTATSLFDLVEQGLFLRPLYYRLNTVYVELP